MTSLWLGLFFYLGLVKKWIDILFLVMYIQFGEANTFRATYPIFGNLYSTSMMLTPFLVMHRQKNDEQPILVIYI